MASKYQFSLVFKNPPPMGTTDINAWFHIAVQLENDKV